LVCITVTALSQRFPDSAFIKANYAKMERMIPVRDGVHLFTSINVPTDQDEKYPFRMQRTPYS
jgi:predicted acyl esterase